MTIPNKVLPPHMVKLVEKAAQLQIVAPKVWEEFLDAYGKLFQYEFDKWLADQSVDPNHNLVAKGRMKFADTLGDVLLTVRERWRAHLDALEKQAETKNMKDISHGP